MKNNANNFREKIALQLNLGCGYRHLDEWINVDTRSECAPDQIVDLECFPWPWTDNSVDRIAFHHVLEHLGASSKVFLQIICELWRVCKHGASIEVVVPHPRTDEFLWDPTHVRAITPEGLRMFSQLRNHEMISLGNPETPLGLYLGVDFDIGQVQYRWHRRWRDLLTRKEVTEAALQQMAVNHMNVISEIAIEMTVIKPTRYSNRT